MIRRVSWVLLLGCPFAAHADYEWELAGLFDHAERNAGSRRPTDEVDSDLLSLSATHYFNPVEEGSGPPALAAFFDPRTQLSIAAGEEHTTDRSFGGPNSFFNSEGKEEVSDYSLRGLYLFPESKWYAGGRYARHEGERRTSSSSINPANVMGSGMSSSDVQDYALFAGKYFGTGATRLELSLEQSTEETEISSTSCNVFGSCSTFSFNGETTFDTPTLAVMHVRRLRSATYALLGEYSETQERFEGQIFDLPAIQTYFVGAELYPVPTVGVRLGYESFKSPAFDEETVSIGASWFFRRNVGLDLTLSREDANDNNPFSDDDPRHTDRAALRVIGRL
ncbi:MAG TPA: hypothetical protein VN818_01225 [Gammaproteobacteria bacterium]|nr:hypothetical protein [Gammaproteobacteria bacterium]